MYRFGITEMHQTCLQEEPLERLRGDEQADDHQPLRESQEAGLMRCDTSQRVPPVPTPAQLDIPVPEQQLGARVSSQKPQQANGVIPDTEEVSPPAAGEPVHGHAIPAAAAPADAVAGVRIGGEVAGQGQQAPPGSQQGEGQAVTDVAGGEQPRESQGMEGLEEQGRSDAFRDDKAADLPRSKAASAPPVRADDRWALQSHLVLIQAVDGGWENKGGRLFSVSQVCLTCSMYCWFWHAIDSNTCRESRRGISKSGEGWLLMCKIVVEGLLA